MPETIKKITTGFVTQTFEDGKCIDQEFTAGDQVDWEDEVGNVIDDQNDNPDIPYVPFHMVQPAEKHTVMIHWGEIGTRIETFKENGEDAISEYEFDTHEELNAFLQGLSEADGWFDHHQIDTEEEKTQYISELKEQIGEDQS